MSNHPTLPTFSARFWFRTLAATALASCAVHSVWATIDNRDTAELFVIVWDPVREASYSLDLGIAINDFRISAQQDTGVQQFWKLDPATDAPFASLRALGTDVASLRWAVLAFDAQFDTFEPGDRRGFVTLRQGPAEGVLNPSYTALIAATNTAWAFNYQDGMAAYVDLVSNIGPSVDPINNNHQPAGVVDFAWNGSSFDVKGKPGYFGAEAALGSSPATYFDLADVTNAVGQSSWFYGLTDSSYDAFEPIAVDEFDNIGHDGYWGLAQDTDGTFALSYTLPSALRTAQQREFALSIGRSEIDGGFATRRLRYTDAGTGPQTAGDFTRRLAVGDAGAGGAVSPVPEAQSAWLMLAGLGALAALARRQRRPV